MGGRRGTSGPGTGGRWVSRGGPWVAADRSLSMYRSRLTVPGSPLGTICGRGHPSLPGPVHAARCSPAGETLGSHPRSRPRQPLPGAAGRRRSVLDRAPFHRRGLAGLFRELSSGGHGRCATLPSPGARRPGRTRPSGGGTSPRPGSVSGGNPERHAPARAATPSPGRATGRRGRGTFHGADGEC